MHLEFVAADGAVLRTEHRTSTTLAWWDGVPPGIGWGEAGSVVLHASFLPDWTGAYLLGAAGVGHLTITVDGEIVADRPTAVPHDPVEAMTRPGQVRAGLELQAGREVTVRVQFRPAADGEGPLGMRLGIERASDDDATLAAAVAAAQNADAAIVVVGSAELTESEGFDRPSLALPGRQDDLVRQVAAVNPRTIVVVNSGMPVLMPWAGDVAAIIQAWLPGQDMGEALADVLFGDAEPGGRLPVTLPAAEADCPVLDTTPDNGVLEYSEGLLLGYRGYDAHGVSPLFPFGHGLGYTTWDYEFVQALTTDYRPGRDLDLRVVVRNTGSRPGREVVQAYLAGPPGEPGRPVRVLAAFGIASAGPGRTSRGRAADSGQALRTLGRRPRHLDVAAWAIHGSRRPLFSRSAALASRSRTLTARSPGVRADWSGAGLGDGIQVLLDQVQPGQPAIGIAGAPRVHPGNVGMRQDQEPAVRDRGDDGVGNVLRHDRVRSEQLLHPRIAAVEHAGPYAHRADRLHGQAAVPVREREPLGERQRAVLGDRIRCRTGSRQQAGRGYGADQVPAPPFQPARQQQARRPDMGHDVHVPGVSPVLLARLRPAATRDPGIGAVQVDLAEFGTGGLDQCRDAILRRGVTGDGRGLAHRSRRNMTPRRP